MCACGGTCRNCRRDGASVFVRRGEFKAGDVAMVSAANRTDPYRAYFDGKTWREHGAGSFCVDSPTAIRPLVVLDCLMPKTFVKHLRAAAENDANVLSLTWIADQIEVQSTPPRPPEPQGLGAVVEDAEGKVWVRWTDGDGCVWLRPADHLDEKPRFVHYADIAAVKELAPGWSE